MKKLLSYLIIIFFSSLTFSFSLAIIACYDWDDDFLAEKKGWGDHFRVTLSSKEFDKFAIENQ